MRVGRKIPGESCAQHDHHDAPLDGGVLRFLSRVLRGLARRGGSMIRLVLALVLLAFTVACSSDPPGTLNDGGGDAGTPLDVVSPDATSSGAICVTDRDCDDQNPCTTESCVNPGERLRAACVITTNEMACPAGQVCDPRRGCTAGRACGMDVDCRDDDPCTVMERCDPGSRTCLHRSLDGDGDGFPPVSCGGRDCDDNDRERHPRRLEICNGRDDNCNGMTDENETNCGGETPFDVGVCMSGTCRCPTGYTSTLTTCMGPHRRLVIENGRYRYLDLAPLRSFLCINFGTDSYNCGTCGNNCGAAGRCEAGGTCSCPSPGIMCGDYRCIDPRIDPENCGRCANRCPYRTTCTEGECRCPAGLTMCTPERPELSWCTDLMVDPTNCGACGNRCTGRCVAGRCVE